MALVVNRRARAGISGQGHTLAGPRTPYPFNLYTGELLDQWRHSVDDGKVAGEVGLELDCSDVPGQGSLQRDGGRQSTRGG